MNVLSENMKRQRKHEFEEFNDFQLSKTQLRSENAVEAVVQDGETLQSIALRFYCTVAEIKRLNKIDKDNEIYARKTIKVPLTPHSVLLETLPDVHKSGQNSPKQINVENSEKESLSYNSLNNKLQTVSNSSPKISKNNEQDDSINNIILNSTVKSTCDIVESANQYNFDDYSINEPLLSSNTEKSIIQPTRLSSKDIFDCSGSDCDISWICLFICILAICFAIPLIYVFYIAEHIEKFHNSN